MEMENERSHEQQTCLNRLLSALLTHNMCQQYECMFLKKTVLNELLYMYSHKACSSSSSRSNMETPLAFTNVHHHELMDIKNSMGYMLENVMFTNESFSPELIREIKALFHIRLFDQRAKNNANYVVALLKKLNISSQFIGVLNRETSHIMTKVEMATTNYKRCAQDISIFGVFL